MPMGEPVSGPRKWLRSATSIFSNKLGTATGLGPKPQPASANVPAAGAPPPKKKFDAPVPLSEFAKRQKSVVTHSGHGRRDQLSAGERTRILRMLRDEGGRMADEDSQVYIGTAPPGPNDQFDFDDSPAPAPVLRDVPAKPAVVVGLAQAQANAKARSKRPDAKGASRVMPAARPQKRSVPPPFTEEPTRQVNNEMLAQLRAMDAARQEEPTRLANQPLTEEVTSPAEMATRAPLHLPALEIDDFSGQEEATRLANLDGLAAMERARPQTPARGAHTDERTRAVDIRNDKSISDIDWDLD